MNGLLGYVLGTREIELYEYNGKTYQMIRKSVQEYALQNTVNRDKKELE